MKKNKLTMCIALISCLSGCANMEKLPVSIYDSNVETMLDVREGTTVRNVLKKAEIVLDDGDTVSPALGTAVTEGETDIVIKRCKTDQQDDTEMDIDEMNDTDTGDNADSDIDSNIATETTAHDTTDSNTNDSNIDVDTDMDSNVDSNANTITKNEKTKTKPQKQTAEETEAPENGEPEIVSKEKIYDCDGSGHGYYLIKWSDGREEYEDF